LREIWKELNVPDENRTYIAGGYIPSFDMVLFVYKPSVYIEEHEMFHKRSKGGIRVGNLGNSLNEGITDYLAVTKVYKDPRRARTKYKFSGYAPEVDLVRNIKSWQPKIYNAMLERYMGDNSMNFETEIINKYGASGLLDLFCANPYVGNREQGKNYGHLLETKAVQKKLGLARRLLF